MPDKKHFHGDFDRNEVEVDLDRFMAILHENSELKDQIRELQLRTLNQPMAEVDTRSKDYRRMAYISASIHLRVYGSVILLYNLVHGT